MGDLTDRERDILSRRRLVEDPVTLEDLSQEYGISRERVRQIEVRAFEKLQKAIVITSYSIHYTKLYEIPAEGRQIARCRSP